MNQSKFLPQVFLILEKIGIIVSTLRKRGIFFLLISCLVISVSFLTPSIRAAPTTWSIETVDAATDVGMETSLALHNGIPAISYLDAHWSDLKYARWTGTSWSIEAVDTAGMVGKNPSLALDSNGYPHISYYDLTNRDLKYARWTGSAWNIKTVDSTGDVGIDSSLVLDSSGNPHISYTDLTNYDLRYARWTGSAWALETVDSTGDVGWYPSLVLDSNGYPHISYQDETNYDLKYAWWTGFAWNIETVDSTGEVGTYTSLVLDSSSNPHISYTDMTNSDLKYAWWTGFAWNIETIDSTGLTGMYTSLALDSTGNPHISYYDATDDDLRYAWWTGSAWSIETVDSTGAVGWGLSLALDSGNNPHISYYDNTSANLKYAAGVHAPPTVPTIESCNLIGEKKDSFDMGEIVFVNGSGFSPSTGYNLYVVMDQATWTDGMTIPERVPDTEPFIYSNADRTVGPITVWHDPQTAGGYDIVVDVDGNGQYDIGTDALDDNDVEATAGFVISESAISDTTPPSITILSPESGTPTSNEVSLTFTVNEPTPWMAYSLDEQENQTIAGNTTLFDLADGLHNLIVYAEDTSGNIGASQIVQFTVEAGEPEPLPEPFPMWAVVVIGIVAGGAVVVLVYFAKIRKPSGKGK